MILETERLRIIPLTIDQFRLLLCESDKWEEEMNLSPSGESWDIHTYRAMEMLYKEALLHPDNYYWYTNWQIILKSRDQSIGSACFMKEPDEKGEVEIGYGINEAFRNNGYMTEAVICMCRWALDQENVRVVMAETEATNYSSHQVLEKSGMKKIECSNDLVRWKIGK